MKTDQASLEELLAAFLLLSDLGDTMDDAIGQPRAVPSGRDQLRKIKAEMEANLVKKNESPRPRL